MSGLYWHPVMHFAERHACLWTSDLFTKTTAVMSWTITTCQLEVCQCTYCSTSQQHFISAAAWSVICILDQLLRAVYNGKYHSRRPCSWARCLLLSLTWLCCARPEHHEGDEETSKTQGKLHFARLLTITPVTHMSNKVFRYLKGNIGSWQFQKLGPHARVMTSSVCPNSSMHKLNATKTVGSFVVLIVTNVLTGFDHWYSMPLLLTLRSSRRLGGFWHTPSVRLTPPTVHWLVEGKTLSLINTPISLISLSHWLIRIDIQLFSWCTVYTCLRPWPIHFPKCA